MTNEPMTEQELREIEGLAAAATEGTWVVDKMGRFEDHDECRISLPDDEIELCRYENADFIVASRLAVPQMAAEIRRAWDENEKILDELHRVCKFSDELAHIMGDAIKQREKVKDALRKQIRHTLRARKQRDALTAEVERLRTAEESLVVENARLRAELEAAKEDMRALSDEYKFCNMCKYHNGEGVDTCSHPLRFSCDAENFYDWRGIPANTPAQGATDENGGKENG